MKQLLTIDTPLGYQAITVEGDLVNGYRVYVGHSFEGKELLRATRMETVMKELEEISFGVFTGG